MDLLHGSSGDWVTLGGVFGSGACSGFSAGTEGTVVDVVFDVSVHVGPVVGGLN